ncbi:MAG: pimeloyl-ACP methyl ester carboxylesterase [Myxococcota bacterium]|jgi:pimeloyl-ACP methyl ester carboxylesterase
MTILQTLYIPRESDIIHMPRVNVLGGGRDRAFSLPQFFFRKNGRRTAFADSGGSGPPILFVHGLGGNATHWLHVAPNLVDTHRVLCVDLFGHGESDRIASGYSVNSYVEQIVSLLDGLGIEKVTIVGHSMGGMVSMALSLAAPERIERTVLVNPAGMQPQILPFRAGGFFVMRQQILGRVLPKSWKWILRQVFFQDNPWTRQFIKTCDETYDEDEVYAMAHMMESLRPDLLGRNYAAMLPSVTVPIFLIWGDRDRLVPVRFLRRAAEDLPNVTLEEIPECGHMPNIERADRVNAFLRNALAA